MKKTIFSYFFIFFTIFFSGCDFVPFAGPIVSGIIMWKDGEAKKYYYEEPETLHRSVKSALKKLNYSIFTDIIEKDGSYYIIADSKDRFKIYIRKVEPHISEVRIRINFMGDKPYAELIYKFIESNSDTIEFNENGQISSFLEN